MPPIGDTMESLLGKHWHHLPDTQVVELLGVDPERGLDIFETRRRLERFGENRIVGKRARTPLERFALQFHQPLVYILLAAALVTGVLQEWVDASVIFGVVLANALVGFIQESKAVRALGALAASMRVEAEVLREGEAVRLDAAGLVPGDVVLLRSGDKVPADLRLISARELRVDESALTGESLPVDKDTVPAPHDAGLADRPCMAYAGTLVSYGQGRGLVVATGNATEIGRISGLMDAAEDLETPLTRKIAHFSHRLLVAILVLAAACFLVGVLRHQPVAETFMAAVALAVGAIPEGLPAAVTIILAMGVSRMAVRRAIIRKLPAVETLGGTTVICSDKTGTLTENQMTVREIHCAGRDYRVTGTGYAPAGEVLADSGVPASGADAALESCLRAGLLCNDARIVEQDGRFAVEGDPTEAALLVAAAKFGLDRTRENRHFPRLAEQPFESQLQYMATLHRMGGEGLVCLKGAVETVLAVCGSALDAEGRDAPLDAEAVTRVQNDMAGRGLRVLALACKLSVPLDADVRAQAASGMVFLGLQGMIDPPRQEARDAVAACRRAGVAVKMITGDHVVTARAIGAQIGLGAGSEAGVACGEDDCPAVTGRELEALGDRELMELVPRVHVFARVSPEQKLRLVMALQATGEICAMTGDGVNDAPALKQADIGIAMGVGGTEAAKEAADMVLTDDNFATIEAAVEEGRGVFDNLVKFIAWTLPTNAGEGLVILAAILFGAVLPILPVQILWINMTTAGFLGIMLAFEPKEPGIMDRPPRRPDRPLLDAVVWRRILLVSGVLLVSAFGLFELEMVETGNVARARTLAVNVFVMVEALYLFNARSFTRSPLALGLFTNPWVPVGVACMLLGQLVYTYAPFMHALFGSAPIGVLDWLKVLGCGVAAFLLVELDKRRTAVRA